MDGTGLECWLNCTFFSQMNLEGHILNYPLKCTVIDVLSNLQLGRAKLQAAQT